MTTPYHAAYWAHLLTLRGSPGSVESISRAVAGAKVDLNPHQVDAALFAVRSPLSKGILLADEVGLGKTIEAGIVMAQRWAERKRRILVIVPATLRKQWQQELESKFFLPTRVIDSAAFGDGPTAGAPNPFNAESVTICSYHFASAKDVEVRSVAWDLVVIDEAHRLRNVYKKSSKLAKRVADAVAHAPKLLLTATPLQNSLMELYGLASVLDPHLFGDAESFRERFTLAADDADRNAKLRERLQPVCTRTLRKQVVEYVPFTRRVPITQDFSPSDEEQALYDVVTEYLQREILLALPNAQRELITLVLRKLLASSTFAIAETLDRIARRLERDAASPEPLLDDEDLEGVDQLADELAETNGGPAAAVNSASLEAALRQKMAVELADLQQFVQQARRITVNAKGEALIPALRTAFERATSLGAERKAVIFTESRRTQQYLYDLLSVRGYEGQIVLMNGPQSDPASRAIYEAWRARQTGEAAQVSRAVGIRTAIIEHFRDHAAILIATETAADVVNLQFCSLVVNYDLPWNPQRIEQRIGRCHRYGQKHDVVVVNFINRRNAADARVYELLSEKFQLFDGLFGASDEVLGALESGVDVERRIAAVYRTCRSATEIAAAFDRLQAELEEQIRARMLQTRQLLLEHFDEEVSARLRVHRDRTVESLGERERWLLALTRTELGAEAAWEPEQPRFRYVGSRAASGWYNFAWKEAERRGDVFYRQDHALAARLIEAARDRSLPPVSLRLDYPPAGQVVSAVQPYRGASGWLECSRLVVESVGAEDFLALVGRADDGRLLDEETCAKFMMLPAAAEGPAPEPRADLTPLRDAVVARRLGDVQQRNARLYDDEVVKLDRWSDDLKQGLERELKEIDRQLRELRRKTLAVVTLQEKLDAQKAVKALEAARAQKRRSLFEAQDAIDGKRDGLIQQLEGQLAQRHAVEPVFTIRWSLA